MKRSILSLLLVFTLPLAAQSVRQNMVVTTDWLADHLAGTVILEIGDPTTYAAGHIPGARLIPLTELVMDREGTPNELPTIASLQALFTRAGTGDRDRIVVYSRDPIHAARAWFTLDYLGHGSRTSLLDGGFAKWTAEERAVSTETPAIEPAAFEARLNEAVLTPFKAVRELVRYRDVLGGNLAIIDARSPEQYRGTEAGAEVARAGHIPGAKNVPWNENLTTGAIPRLLPERELRELYRSAGVSRESTNVVYCRSGMQATVTYFALRYLGYDAALYDGSFVEWSRTSTNEVAAGR